MANNETYIEIAYILFEERVIISFEEIDGSKEIFNKIVHLVDDIAFDVLSDEDYTLTGMWRSDYAHIPNIEQYAGCITLTKSIKEPNLKVQ